MELPKTKTQFSTPLHIPICTFSFSKIKFVTVHIFQEVILANYRHQKCFYVLKIKMDQQKTQLIIAIFKNRHLLFKSTK